MVLLPLLAAAAIASASHAVGSRIARGREKARAGEETGYRTKEAKRETKAGLLEEARDRATESTLNKLSEKKKMGKRKAQSAQDTATLVREAFNI